MRFSVFTPTHRPTFIDDAFESLLGQSNADWEWLLVPNGGAVIPDRIRAHPQVRVVAAPDWVSRLGIGALKRFACEQCAGDYLVELDHDDLLTADALAKISAAIDTAGAEFLYSDFANFRADGTCEVYDRAYGWQSYPFAAYGRNYTALRAFPPDASALHLIFFAPNHVRVWSRAAYQRAGGHDSTLGVTDDHDLVCRTYLTGAKFHYIPSACTSIGCCRTVRTRICSAMRRSSRSSRRFRIGTSTT
jgi:glycosyltransferase involved in cell wall biosynthesis